MARKYKFFPSFFHEKFWKYFLIFLWILARKVFFFLFMPHFFRKKSLKYFFDFLWILALKFKLYSNFSGKKITLFLLFLARKFKLFSIFSSFPSFNCIVHLEKNKPFNFGAKIQIIYQFYRYPWNMIYYGTCLQLC